MSGETGFTAGAEGATAPETLRQKDRMARTASGKRPGSSAWGAQVFGSADGI